MQHHEILPSLALGQDDIEGALALGQDAMEEYGAAIRLAAWPIRACVALFVDGSSPYHPAYTRTTLLMVQCDAARCFRRPH